MVSYREEEPIVVVGAACRFSGDVSSPEGLWEMMSNARTGHCKVPADRWDADKLYHPDADRKGTMAVKHGYFLKQDISHFDAPFFQTTAKEAASMDPMKRLLLEVSYESIENAGIPIDTLINSQTGCYVGCMTNDYEMLSSHDMQDLGYTAGTSNSEAMTANRVSWFYGLRGPSLTLDTACSSSLYALHLACQSLKLGEADMFLVAGVNLMLYPNTMEQFSAIHMLSPEGISHSFDDRANGYGRGEGIGCVVVKRLSDALRDGDTIRAVIRGTGANADGKTPSITAPSSDAQADLIRRTYAHAGLELTSTQYFEAHGTGTPVGDPIECNAIASTFGVARKEAGLGPLYIGSVKSGLGHTEGCAGMAGLLKAILCLEKGMLVPTYDVQRLNPKLTLEEWNLALPSGTIKWPTPGQRRISVNSFGFGGANSHVILEDAYHYLKDQGLIGNHNTIVHEEDEEYGSDSGLSMGQTTPDSDEGERLSKQLFVLSTRDQAGTQRISKALAANLSSSSQRKAKSLTLDNLAYTLAERRSHHNFRTFAVASSISELISELSKPIPRPKQVSKLNQNLVFVCTGQGAQWPAMGNQLLEHPIFKASVEASCNILEAQGCSWDAMEELQKTGDSRIALPEFSQTLCSVLQVALVDLLRHWGIVPKATVGHSSGEIAAAYAAQYLSHEDAIRIAYVRGISSAMVTQEGAMMAAGLSRTDAEAYIERLRLPEGSAVVACVNSPSSVTLSGDVDAINLLEKQISADGKFARKLKVKTAYHSPHMRTVAKSYFEKMGSVATLTGGNIVMYSSLTGKIVSPEQLNAQYWVDNMCAPVEFSTAVTALLAHESQPVAGRSRGTPLRWGGFIEIGPHSALQGPVQQIITAAGSKTAKEAPYVGLVLRGKDATETSLAAVGSLWAVGIDIDVSIVNGTHTRSSVHRPTVLSQLPMYTWNHTKGFWHEAFTTRHGRFPLAPRTDLLGVPEDLQNPLEPRWRNFLRISENPWIEDHKITGTVLYPGAGMLVMAMEGALQIARHSGSVSAFRFSNVTFDRGMVVGTGEEQTAETRLSLLPDDTQPGNYRFTIFSTSDGSTWTKHCFGEIALQYDTHRASIETSTSDLEWTMQSETFARLRADRGAEEVDIDTFYDDLESIGMEYGPLFRNVTSLSSVPSQKACYGTIVIPDTRSSMPSEFEFPHVIHPATLDAIFHLLLAAVDDGRPTRESAVPYSLEDMWIAADQPQGAGSEFAGYSELIARNGNGREVVLDMVVSDDSWSIPKIIAKGFALRQVSGGETEGDAGSASRAQTKSASIDWIEDIDFAQGDQRSLRSFLELAIHKDNIHNALVIIEEESELDAMGLQEYLGQRPGIDNIAVWNCASGEKINTDKKFDLALFASPRVASSQILLDVKSTLSETGKLLFSGIENSDSIVKTSLSEANLPHYVSAEGCIVAKNFPAKPDQQLPSDVYFLLPAVSSDSLTSTWSNLAGLLSSVGVSVHLSSDINISASGKYIISFLEVDSPLIYSWNEAQFKDFKALVATQKHVFWITRGGVLESWNGGVEFAPAQGLLRVIRNEYPFASFPQLDLSPAFELSKLSNAQTILDVWKSSLHENGETEFAELGGKIYIPRAVSERGFDGDLLLANGTAQPTKRGIHLSEKPVKFSHVIGDGRYLWTDDDTFSNTLGANEVEIDVHYIGLHATQASITSQTDISAHRLAREVTGVITRCGSNVTSLHSGQQVVTYSGDALKSRIRQKQSSVAAIPWNMSLKEAVSIPGIFILAQYGLLEAADLTAGQTVLVHNAVNAIGQAVIQVAQKTGANVYALVEREADRDELIARYGIPRARIFDSARANFIAAVQHATQGRGADVIFCAKPGPAVLKSLKILDKSGYVIDAGVTSGKAPQIVLPASKCNATVVRVDLESLRNSKPRVFERLFRQTFAGPIMPIAATGVYSVHDIALAATAAFENKLEPVVIAVDKEAQVWTMPPPAAPLCLDENATYVLAGGLGSLGLDIAKMMTGNGAKHLVFLSRSGGDKNKADIDAFKAQGVLAEAFKCDVNDSKSVKDVFDNLRAQGRVVKGVVQCAMVLEDMIFENMTHEKWWRAFQPKTRGSRNLLDNLTSFPKTASTPFFIFLSSITGVIGNTAQANYASGNSFEDALAHHARKHLGIAATSIDVGLVNDASHFGADGMFGDLKSYLTKYQHGWQGLQCTLEELRTTLRAIMRGSTADGQEIPAQVVLGLEDTIRREAGTTGFQHDPKFNLRVSASNEATAQDGAGKGFNVAEKLASATTFAEASAAVEEAFRIQVAVAFGIEVGEVDASRPMPELGVDSLKAVEIRNRVLKEMQSEVSVFELLSAIPMTEVAVKIASRSVLVKHKSE